MKKLYVKDLKKVMEFDFNDFETHFDEEGNLVANTKEDYDWMIELNNAIEFLEENFNKKEYEDRINDYNDYIFIANELKKTI